jgi:hypothetical protein
MNIQSATAVELYHQLDLFVNNHVQYLSDTFLLLRGAFSLRHCEEQSDEAIWMDLARNEIATPRQVGARNDMGGYYPMLQGYYKLSLSYLRESTTPSPKTWRGTYPVSSDTRAVMAGS